MFQDLPIGFALIVAVVGAAAVGCLTAYGSISRRTQSKAVRFGMAGPFAVLGLGLLGLCALAIIGNMFAWVPILLWKLFASNG